MNSNSYYIYIYMNFFSLMIMIFMVLMGVAFLTILERKMLGYIQERKGPNKVGVNGIFQPFSDALKLLSNQVFFVFKSFYGMYFLSPLMSMVFMLMCWYLLPFFTNIYFLNYSVLGVVVIMSLNSYLLMFMGWSSNSLYSIIGAIRSISQVLSYEVSFILIIVIMMIMSESYALVDFMKWQMNYWFMISMLPLYLIFFISSLIELNRSPFDFIEGESELVSGFNIEYYSGSFTLIFLVEYGMIMFISVFMVMMFTSVMSSFYLMFVMVIFTCSLVIFMRGVLPRMRYDELMYLCWKIILPMVLNYLIYIMSIKTIMVIL